METLALNFRHWVAKSVFLTHSKLLNNWRPKDNFRLNPILDIQEKNHLVCNNFCAAIFVLLFLYFKSRGQISCVTCAVITRLPASGKLVPSTLISWLFSDQKFESWNHAVRYAVLQILSISSQFTLAWLVDPSVHVLACTYLTTGLFKLTKNIDPMQKWLPLYYSFVQN